MSEGDEREPVQPVASAPDGHGPNRMHELFFKDSGLRPIWRFFVAGLLAYGANYVAAVIAFTTLRDHPIVADAVYRGIGLLLLAAVFRFMLEVVDEEPGDPWVSMGLPRSSSALRDAAKGALVGAGMIVLAVAMIALLGHVSPVLHWKLAALGKLLIVTVGLLFGAMLEEMMFRGYPFQRLIESVGAAWAVVVLSALFGVVHFFNPSNGGIWSWEFLDTLLIGVLLAIAYLRTRSLWMPFGIHFAWNFTLGVLLGLPVSGLKDFGVVIHSTAAGPRWLTGGAYGLEGSVTGALVIACGFVPVFLLTRKLPPHEDGKRPETGL